MAESDARAEITAATDEALCARSDTDPTAQDIADRTDESKSQLFYHDVSTEDLTIDIVEFLLEQFDERVERTRDRPPIERLPATSGRDRLERATTLLGTGPERTGERASPPVRRGRRCRSTR